MKTNIKNEGKLEIFFYCFSIFLFFFFFDLTLIFGFDFVINWTKATMVSSCIQWFKRWKYDLKIVIISPNPIRILQISHYSQLFFYLNQSIQFLVKWKKKIEKFKQTFSTRSDYFPFCVERIGTQKHEKSSQYKWIFCQ